MAAGVGNDVVRSFEGVVVDAENNRLHAVALTGSGDDDFLGACVDVALSRGVLNEETSRLDDDVDAELTPWESLRAFFDGQRLDGLPVDDECVLVWSLDRVVFEEVRKVVSGNEVVDRNHFHIAAEQPFVHDGPENEPSDTAEAVDSDFCRHVVSYFLD